MKTLFLTLIAMLAAAFAVPALADSVKLGDNVEMKGTIKQITMESGGKTATFEAKDVRLITLDKTGDVFLMTDGKRVKGALVSVVLSTDSGDATYVRADISSVTIDDPAAALREEYKQRRAKLDLKDPKAILELAKWAKEKGLKSEAYGLAQACLKQKPDDDTAMSAHEVLDQVLVDGQWISKEQADKNQASSSTDSSDSTDPKPKDLNAMTPEEKEQLRAAAAKNTELRQTYVQKVKDAKDQDLQAIKDANDKEWAKLQTEIKESRDSIANYERYLRNDRYGRYSYYVRELATEKDNLKGLLAKQDRQAATIKDAQTKAQKKADERTSRVTNAFNRNTRLLGLGHILTEEQMTAVYDKAYGSE